jgi:hypothetical protein
MDGVPMPPARRRSSPTVVAVLAALAVQSAAGSAASLDLDLDTPIGRWRAGGHVEGYAIVRTDPDSPGQDPAGTLRLELRGDLHRSVRFFLDTRLAGGGLPKDAVGFGIENLADTFQNKDPVLEFEEGYVDVFLGPVDVRLGKQKFAWGKLDTFQPTDVLGPRRYQDPFIVTGADAKIGIPSVQASYYAPPLGPGPLEDMRFTLVWVPIPFPIRFPLTRERWFPPTTSVQDLVVFEDVPLGSQTIDIVARNALATRNRTPPQTLDEGAVGLRVSGLYEQTDWSLYFYDGTETAPAFDFETSVACRPAPAPQAGCDLPSPGEPLRIRSESTLVPRFDRMRLVGADVAAGLDRFTVRAEAAFGMDRLLPRSVESLLSDLEDATTSLGDEDIARFFSGQSVPIDLGDLSVARDTVEWGVGIDYLYRGWTPLVQINQIAVLDNDTDLLLSDVDTQLLIVLRKSFLAERLATEVAVVQGFARGYTTGTTRFTYELTDNLRLRLGYLLIAGSRRTLIGQFHDNDQAFFQVRYSF